MARANTTTWLSLDEWATIMGYNAWTFNGFAAWPCQGGDCCDDVWYQYPDQYETVSREELAIAIRQAEEVISDYVGFNLLPDWNVSRVETPRFYNARYDTRYTANNAPKSVQVDRRLLRQLGIKAKRVITEGATITRIDRDGDGFEEMAQVTVPNDTDRNQIRLFYPNQNGADEWEIRPVKFINSYTVEFPVYMIPKPNLLGGTCPDALDPDNPDNYITSVDIYQIYNDTSAKITQYYENLCSCGMSSTESNGYIKNERLGYVAYNPCNCGYEPQRVEIPIYSGFTGRTDRPLIELDYYWKQPIAYFAASLLNKPCKSGCGGDEHNVSIWQVDLMQEESMGTAYRTTTAILENIFGVATKGAWYAYQRSKVKVIT